MGKLTPVYLASEALGNKLCSLTKSSRIKLWLLTKKLIQKRNQTTDVSILSGLFLQNGVVSFAARILYSWSIPVPSTRVPSYLKILEHR